MWSIDKDSKMCYTCLTSFGIDSKEKTCRECSVQNCSICTNNYQACMFCKDEFTLSNGERVYDQIPADSPLKQEKQVEVSVSIDNDKNLVKIEKPKEETTNKNYVININQNVNDKTIIIDDLDQSNLGIVINNNITNLNIQ